MPIRESDTQVEASVAADHDTLRRRLPKSSKAFVETLVEWCDLNGIPVFATPNGGMHPISMG